MSDSDANNPFASDLEDDKPTKVTKDKKSLRTPPPRPAGRPKIPENSPLSARHDSKFKKVNKKVSLNPFGSDDDDEEEEDNSNPFADDTVNRTAILNPFGDDDNDEDKNEKETNPFDEDDVKSQDSNCSLPKNSLSKPNNSEKFQSYDPKLNPFGLEDDDNNETITTKKTKRNAPKAPKFNKSIQNTASITPDREASASESQGTFIQKSATTTAVKNEISDFQEKETQNTSKTYETCSTPFDNPFDEEQDTNNRASNSPKQSENVESESPKTVPRGKKNFKNLRPERKKISLAIEKPTKSNDEDDEETSQSSKSQSQNTSARTEKEVEATIQPDHRRSPSPKRRAPDAPPVAPRENDSKIDLEAVLSKLDRISLDLVDIRKSMDHLQPAITGESNGDSGSNSAGGSKSEQKKWEMLLISQQNLTLEQSELLLKKELYILCDKHWMRIFCIFFNVSPCIHEWTCNRIHLNLFSP